MNSTKKVPKREIKSINSSKNKLNSKISWFFNLEPNAHFREKRIKKDGC